MKIIVSSYSFGDRMLIGLSFLGGIAISLLMLFHGLLLFNFFTLISGGALLSIYIWYCLTWEREIVFTEDQIKIITPIRTVCFSYTNVENVKFKWMGRFIEDGIVIALKKKILFRSYFSFEISNKKENILMILNYFRAKGIPTGLNETGEKYFQYNKQLGEYELK
jgi:hypothetical protein